MVGMPGFLARFSTRVLGQGLGTENTMYSITGTEKYSVQYYLDGNIQFYSTTGMEKNGGENHVWKIPYY